MAMFRSLIPVWLAAPAGPGSPVSGSRKGGGVSGVMSFVVAVAVVASLLTGASVSFADSDPVNPLDPGTPVTVTADALPTVQVDGVVWKQAVVGNTVYVVGKFTKARPAGAAPGTNEVVRNNILAYDIRTGELNTAFNADLNAQAVTVQASPDGSRVYVGGSFTQVNGAARSYVAALDAVTGATITSFTPWVNSRVTAIAATNTTVYLGGWFSGVGKAARSKLAAVAASNAALLPWAPQAAGGDVTAMVLSPDASKVVVGGSFTTVNGSGNPGYGLAAVDTTQGKLVPWAANNLVRNAGQSAAITSLNSDGTNVYGTGYTFGDGGNLEGAFSANWADGTIKWIEDCHGDSYGVYASKTAVYTVGHAHGCQNIGGFPESIPFASQYHRAIAFSKAATGTITAEPAGSMYSNHAGNPSPSLLNWFPDLTAGTITGQYQAAWAAAGNDDYVVLGGEFPKINGVAQQGLVRFATKALAPNKKGPMIGGRDFNPTVSSPAPGTVQVNWQANWDMDNTNLTYKVIRDGDINHPIHTIKADSTFWNRPAMSYTDTGLQPGKTYNYRIFAQDSAGNTARSEAVTVTTPPPPSGWTGPVVLQGSSAGTGQMGWQGTNWVSTKDGTPTSQLHYYIEFPFDQVAGTTYTFSFNVWGNGPGTSLGYVQASAGGSTLYYGATRSGVAPNYIPRDGVWRPITVSYVATTSGPTVFRYQIGVENAGNGTFSDDIAVSIPNIVSSGGELQ